jgi:hypothetical protein
MVAKLHVNMGHLPVDQMLTMLRAAGAKEEIREYVKNEFRCDQCSRQRRPIEKKKATFPRTFSFNKILGIDYFYISFMNKTHAFLNVVDQGTNLLFFPTMLWALPMPRTLGSSSAELGCHPWLARGDPVRSGIRVQGLL